MTEPATVTSGNLDPTKLRTEAVAAKLSEALALRKKLIDYFTAVLPPPPMPKRRSRPAPKNELLQTISLSAEGWVPTVSTVELAHVDRTVSMIAGPFFTSADYPIPGPEDGKWLPIIQLDLRQLQGLSELNLGDGLLQLWCDANYENSDRGFVRIIPREDVIPASMTGFDFVMPDVEVTPVSSDYIVDPDAETVMVITGFESVGLQCQTGYLDLHAQDLDEQVLEPIAAEIDRFKGLVSSFGIDLQLFGSFYPIQYSAAEVDAFCLVSFPRWGSDGSAQVFAAQEGQETAYTFMESLR